MAVIGDALLDVHVVPSAGVRAGADVPATVRLEPGGQGANLAVRLARRGVPTVLACALAGDLPGRMLRHALETAGVEVRPIATDASGAVVVLVEPGGERTMLSQRVPLLSGARPTLPAEAAWLAVSGYLLLEPEARAWAATVAEGARRAVVGCALADGEAAGWAEAAAALRPDLVVLNRSEAVAVVGREADTDALATDLADRLATVAVVTEPGGASGAVARSAVRIAAPEGRPATDSTGAGDAFAATLIAELAGEPWPASLARLESAMHAASERASAVARAPGAQAVVVGEHPGRGMS